MKCYKDILYLALREYGIERRPNLSRFKLRKYKLSILEKRVREKGVRECVQELGVHNNTLRYYLKRAKEGDLESAICVA